LVQGDVSIPSRFLQRLPAQRPFIRQKASI
jgi:hypothetical protein